MYRVQNPKPDNPGEWAKLRMMQSVDENGRIPDDALVKAHDHVAAMVAAQSDDEKHARSAGRRGAGSVPATLAAAFGQS